MSSLSDPGVATQFSQLPTLIRRRRELEIALDAETGDTGDLIEQLSAVMAEIKRLVWATNPTAPPMRRRWRR